MLDELASVNDLNVAQEELNAYVVEQAYRLGVPPDRLAKEIVDRGQLGMAAAEVLRGKALRLLTEQVPVTDEAGRPVDIKAAGKLGGEDDDDGKGGAGDGGGAAPGTFDRCARVRVNVNGPVKTPAPAGVIPG